MTKQTNDKGDRQTQESRRQSPGGKRIDQDDRELEKLEREQQKARTGELEGEKKPTPHR